VSGVATFLGTNLKTQVNYAIRGTDTWTSLWRDWTPIRSKTKIGQEGIVQILVSLAHYVLKPRVDQAICTQYRVAGTGEELGIKKRSPYGVGDGSNFPGQHSTFKNSFTPLLEKHSKNLQPATKTRTGISCLSTKIFDPFAFYSTVDFKIWGKSPILAAEKNRVNVCLSVGFGTSCTQRTISKWSSARLACNSAN